MPTTQVEILEWCLPDGTVIEEHRYIDPITQKVCDVDFYAIGGTDKLDLTAAEVASLAPCGPVPPPVALPAACDGTPLPGAAEVPVVTVQGSVAIHGDPLCPIPVEIVPSPTQRDYERQCYSDDGGITIVHGWVKFTYLEDGTELPPVEMLTDGTPIGAGFVPHPCPFHERDDTDRDISVFTVKRCDATGAEFEVVYERHITHSDFGAILTSGLEAIAWIDAAGVVQPVSTLPTLEACPPPTNKVYWNEGKCAYIESVTLGSPDPYDPLTSKANGRVYGMYCFDPADNSITRVTTAWQDIGGNDLPADAVVTLTECCACCGDEGSTPVVPVLTVVKSGGSNHASGSFAADYDPNGNGAVWDSATVAGSLRSVTVLAYEAGFPSSVDAIKIGHLGTEFLMKGESRTWSVVDDTEELEKTIVISAGDNAAFSVNWTEV